MAFSLLKRGIGYVQAWLSVPKRPTDNQDMHQYYGRLTDRVAKAAFASQLYTTTIEQPVHATWSSAVEEVPRRQTIPRHVRMDTTPRSVLVCAGCGALAHPWTRKPCNTKGCDSAERIKDVCTCLFLPLDGDRTQHYRIYRKNCHVHNH